jgi:hypothetical protein
MTIAADEDENDDDLAELLYAETTQDCHYHTCISCLLESGFTSDSAALTPTVPTNGRKKKFASFGKERPTS